MFDLPVQRLREGFYSDKYFVRSRDILRRDGHDARVVMQVFTRSSGWLAGVDEAIAILKLCSEDWSDLEVHALHDGDAIDPLEPVMTIAGPYAHFANLETLYLGVLSRRTRVTTLTKHVVQAAAPKGVMFFPARHDHWLLQSGDGYAAHLAGAVGVSTDAQAAWWDGEGLGTLPHSLIAAYGGDTVLAARKFAQYMDESVRLVVLVDFDNDCVRTSLQVAEALGARLHGVRLDTSASLVDVSVVPQMAQFDPRGVNPQLVHNVRDALDQAGRDDVQIVASGGFDVDKIRWFEALDVPVNSYGVGSSLLRNDGGFDFTADLVMTNGEPSAKVGRQLVPNPRLERVV